MFALCSGKLIELKEVKFHVEMYTGDVSGYFSLFKIANRLLGLLGGDCIVIAR